MQAASFLTARSINLSHPFLTPPYKQPTSSHIPLTPNDTQTHTPPAGAFPRQCLAALPAVLLFLGPLCVTATGALREGSIC